MSTSDLAHAARAKCVLKVVTPKALPPGISLDRARAIIGTRTKWLNGTILRYAFLDLPGSLWPEDQKAPVRRAFKAWKALNIGLSFVETADVPDAEIRIGFDQTDGSWSYVGTDLLHNGEGAQNMNFGWDLKDDYGYSTCLHEIGHAIGLHHEHQNRAAGIVWDEEAVYRYFEGSPNYWDRETTFNNILRKLSAGEAMGTRWDPHSIMHYGFPGGLITRPEGYGDGLEENYDLSDLDVDWIRKVYPPLNAPLAIAPMQFERLNVSAGGQRDFSITPDATREYTIQTVGGADCKVVVFEERDGEPRYFAAEDDSGTEKNATIVTRLIKGRTYIIRVRVHFVIAPDGAGLVVS